MARDYVLEKTYEKTDFAAIGVVVGDYENCAFNNCNFLNVDLSAITFSECIFKDCDLSLVKLSNTAFKGVKFKGCKLLGLRFEHCADFLFAVQFEGCNLNLSAFFKKNLKHTRFMNCTLHETDFTESNLTSAIFENCDLQRAIFLHTTLEKADFRSSFNYSIDPEFNRIRRAKFSLAGLAGLLDKYDIEVE